MWSFSRKILVTLSTIAILTVCGGSSTDSQSETQSRIVENSTQTEINDPAPLNLDSDSTNNLSLLDGSKSNEDETVPLRGYYLDSEVKGVNYDCGKYNGKTANDGLFLFEKGEGCSFKLGETVIRDVKPDELFNGITIIEDISM